LGKGEKHDEQSRRHRIETRLDPGPEHVGNRHAKRSAQHQVRQNAQAGQKNPQPEQEDREREPFDAAQVSRDFRLGRGIDRLEKPVAEKAVINDRAIDEPAEARRPVNLAAPFRRAGRSEKNQMFETEQRFGFSVAFLLFSESAERETAPLPLAPPRWG